MMSKAQVHDLELGRYDGPRRPQRERYRVIARHTLTAAWRAKWALRGPLLGAGATLLIAGAIMIVFGKLQSHMHGGPMAGLVRADVAVYRSFEYFAMWGHLMAVTLGCTAIADDLKRGAFHFYFARPIRAGDYLRGKLLGVGILVGLPMLLAPLVLTVVRVCLAADASEALALVPMVGKGLLVGLYGTVAIVLPAVATGALLRSRVPAQAAYLTYYLLVATIAETAAHRLEIPALAVLSPRADLAAVTAWLFDQPVRAVSFFTTDVPVGVALAGLAVMVFGGVAICLWRVRSIERAGIGA
jgi:hypothetical protein